MNPHRVVHRSIWIALVALIATGCVSDADNDTGIRETGYLRCVAATDTCTDGFACTDGDGRTQCVAPPAACDELSCACLDEPVCGQRTCSEEPGAVMCGGSDDPPRDDAAPDAGLDGRLDGGGNINDDGGRDAGRDGGSNAGNDGGSNTSDDGGRSTGGDGGDGDDTGGDGGGDTGGDGGGDGGDTGGDGGGDGGGNQDGSSPGADGGQFGDGSFPRPDGGMAPDGGPQPDHCLVTVEVPVDDGPPTVRLCDLSHAEFSCGELARCVCAATGAADVEECAGWLLTARGAITLADFCHDAERTVADLMEDTSWLGGTAAPPGTSVTATAACGDLSVLGAARLPLMPWIERCPAAPPPQDPVSIVEAEILDGRLRVLASHSGGCVDHAFQLCWSGVFLGADPVGVELTLSHQDPGDPCDQIAATELEFNLLPLRDAWRHTYGEAGGSIWLRWFEPDDGPDLIHEF